MVDAQRRGVRACCTISMISWVIGSGETSRNFKQVLQMTAREKPLSMMRDTRNGFVALVALMETA
jgi:hypothetical protein